MRVNVYAEEMTNRVEVIRKRIDGTDFTGLRFYLALPATVDGKHYQGSFIHRPGDDDSAAVTFWGKTDLRHALRNALALLDKYYARPDDSAKALVMEQGRSIGVKFVETTALPETAHAKD